MTFNLDLIKVTQGQRDLATYIKRETGKVVKPESIALVDALRAEFRKDPEQVAKRQAVKDAARQKDEATLEKTLAKAKALAEKLGHPVTVAEADEAANKAVPEPVLTADLTPEDLSGDDGFDEPNDPEPDEPLATVTSIGTKRVVENDFGADTSKIEVVEQEDGFAVPSDTGEVDDF